MSNLLNLTAKIVQDCEQQALAITQRAEMQAQQQHTTTMEQTEIEAKKMLARAESEARQHMEQRVQAEQLAIRNENLAAKRKMLDMVFEEAKKQLCEMEQKSFWSYLTKTLLSLDLDGEELLLPERYEVTDLNELNAWLGEHGKKGNLTLAQEQTQPIEGGFVLRKNGIEYNNTFPALLDYHREEWESQALALLYA